MQCHSTMDSIQSMILPLSKIKRFYCPTFGIDYTQAVTMIKLQHTNNNMQQDLCSAH